MRKISRIQHDDLYAFLIKSGSGLNDMVQNYHLICALELC